MPHVKRFAERQQCFCVMDSKKKQHHRKPRTTIELLLARKAKNLVAAERTYWQTINSLHTQRARLAGEFGLPFQNALPSSISSTVWALTDGAAFVRYQTV